MKRYAAVAAFGLIAIAGCSSAASTTPMPSSHPTGSASIPGISQTGTETITGKVTGAAAVTNGSPTWHVTFRGPVDTTGTFTPPAGNATHQTATFKTGAGNMVASAVVSGQNAQPQQLANCVIRQVITAVYTVNGKKSTGVFAGASGHGIAKVVFQAALPRLSSGACNMSNSAQPIAKGAFATFSGSGLLTVK